jgi:hypothetical protein
VLAQSKTRLLILDRNFDKQICENAERRKEDISNDPGFTDIYEISLICKAEGPNFLIASKINMKCSTSSLNFVMKFSARNKKEGSFYINFKERMDSKKDLEAEKLIHPFISKEIVTLSIDEKNCELRANYVDLTGIAILMLMLKLLFI